MLTEARKQEIEYWTKYWLTIIVEEGYDEFENRLLTAYKECCKRYNILYIHPWRQIEECDNMNR